MIKGNTTLLGFLSIFIALLFGFPTTVKANDKRIFSSSIELEVSRKMEDGSFEYLGSTRNGGSVRIPRSTKVWIISPYPSESNKIDDVVKLIQKEQIPGVDISFQLSKNQFSKLFMCTDLEYLEIRAWDSSIKEFSGIEQLKNLKELVLSEMNSIDNNVLKSVGKVACLEHLSMVHSNGITSSNLRDLQGLRNLKSLKLFELDNIKNLESMPLFPCLRSLAIKSRFIKNKDLKHLKKMTTIMVMNLSSCSSIGDIGISYLLGTKIQRLNLSFCTEITSNTYKTLGQMALLTHIDLTGCDKLTGEYLSHIAKLPRLDSLSLAFCGKINDSAVKKLQNSKNLKSLALNECSITDKGMGSIATLKTLKKLDVGGCQKVTDIGLEKLKGLKKMESLSLTSCIRITDVGVEVLSSFNSLKAVDLMRCSKVTAKSLETIGKLSLLERLDISETATSGSGLHYLTDLKRLVSLSISDNNVSDKQLRELQALFSLTHLRVSSCPITDKSIGILSQLKRLKFLDISGCEKISKEGVARLRALLRHTRIKSNF